MPVPVAQRRPGGEVVALGESVLVGGFALAGVRTCSAETAADVRRHWSTAQDAAVVILTPAAADALGDTRFAPHAPLTVVLPP